jgi:hypothetical protein
MSGPVRFRSVDELLADARSRLARVAPREAADALNSVGVPATDVVGGFLARRAAGLPTRAGGTAADRLVAQTCSRRPESTS